MLHSRLHNGRKWRRKTPPNRRRRIARRGENAQSPPTDRRRRPPRLSTASEVGNPWLSRYNGHTCPNHGLTMAFTTDRKTESALEALRHLGAASHSPHETSQDTGGRISLNSFHCRRPG